MKKRILTWLLAVSMLGSLLTVPAGAAAVTKFSDVSDSYTATAVETLRLMGVLDGYGDGTFRPDTVLNRAQFCKMAVYAMDGSGELGRYSTVTIFPDVKPSHWASAYINMAARKGIISGFADGKFKPGQTVTVTEETLTDYETTMDDGSSVTLGSSYTATLTGDAAVTCVNNKDGVPPTGLAQDAAPAVWLLAAGAALAVVCRRRREAAP